ncbi:poly(A) polymerase small subunit PAPS [Salmon gill poxvirus]
MSANHKKFKSLTLETCPIMSFDQITKQLKWEKNMDKTVFPHKTNGQLKLLLGELLFFTEITRDTPLFNRENVNSFVVVYVGSCPGFHVPAIDYFFPGLTWELIDPTPMSVTLEKYVHRHKNRYTYTRDYADVKWAQHVVDKYPGKKIVLISDIRTSGDGEPTTQNLLDDYDLQEAIIKKLKPCAWMLKWRCPFPDSWPTTKEVKIPVGKIYVQAFAKPTSAELRIINLTGNLTTNVVTKQEGVIYEEKMCYFNQVLRRSQITNGLYDLIFHDKLYAFEIATRIFNYAWTNHAPVLGRTCDKIYHIYTALCK